MAVPGEAIAKAGSAGAKVAVACKLPNGIIIRGFDASDERENVLGGGTRDVKVYRPSGDEVVIHGTTVRFGVPQPILVNGARITRNVPKDLWDNWYEANKGSDLVRNHLVYAAEQDDRVKDWAKEHLIAKTGLEGIDPDKPSEKVRGIHRAERPK